MMTDSLNKVNDLYTVLDDSVVLLMKELEVSYTSALAETLQNLTNGQVVQQIDGQPSQNVIELLTKQYQSVALDRMTADEKRKAIQLAMIKAIKTDGLQSNHQMTPDSIAYVLLHVLKQLHIKEPFILDMTAGSGNLLSVLLNGYAQDGVLVKSIAVEVDEVLMNILAMSMLLQGHDTQLLFADSVKPLLIDSPNVIVSELPIGFYPDDDVAKLFKVSVSKEHTYAHHLLIEQSLQLLQDNGFGLYIVPENLFESAQAPQLLELLTTDYYIQAFLLLPKTLFKTQSLRKGILVVQKKGDKAKKAKNVLLGEMPSFKDPKAMQKTLKEIEEWAKSIR